MDGLFIEFRDPLFGIIVFFLFVFIIAFLSYWWGRFKLNDDHKVIEKFIEKFHTIPSGNEFKELIGSSEISQKSWLLLAESYFDNGDFERSIEIYQALLETQNDKNFKLNILYLLGITYYKAGFLERAKELYLKILSHKPRSTEVLKYLLLVYEQLKDFDNALDVLESLEELGECDDNLQAYIEVQMLLHNGSLEAEEKVKKLLAIYHKSHQHFYQIFEYIFRVDAQTAWKHFDVTQGSKISDILFRLSVDKCDFDIITKHAYLRELFTAKGYLSEASRSDEFELDVLIRLNTLQDHKATLQFEYVCSNCKQESPFSFHRCPNCYAIDSREVVMMLSKDVYEQNLSFL